MPDAPNASRPSTTPSDGIARSGLAYLDDSPLARETVRRALAARGVPLETFARVDDLLARADAPLVAALLDHDLGEARTGLDAARALRAKRPSLPIAFFTANVAPGLVEQLAAIGPVFNKDREAARALDWLAARAAEPAT